MHIIKRITITTYKCDTKKKTKTCVYFFLNKNYLNLEISPSLEIIMFILNKINICALTTPERIIVLELIAL